MTATMNPSLDELADRVAAEVAAIIRLPQFEACRAVLTDVGIRRARMALVEAPDVIARAQAEYRTAQAAQAAAKEAHAQAVAEAEWTLDGRFVSEGNKGYLTWACNEHAGERPPFNPNCTECGGTGTVRKQMTADERRAWKEREARNVPAVQAAARALAEADEDVAAARDAITVAQARLSAAKHALDAAVAEVTVLAMGLRSQAVAP